MKKINWGDIFYVTTWKERVQVFLWVYDSVNFQQVWTILGSQIVHQKFVNSCSPFLIKKNALAKQIIVVLVFVYNWLVKLIPSQVPKDIDSAPGVCSSRDRPLQIQHGRPPWSKLRAGAPWRTYMAGPSQARLSSRSPVSHVLPLLRSQPDPPWGSPLNLPRPDHKRAIFQLGKDDNLHQPPGHPPITHL